MRVGRVLDAQHRDELVGGVGLRVEVRISERGVHEAVDLHVAVERPRHDLLVLGGVGVEDVREVRLALVADHLPRLLGELIGDRRVLRPSGDATPLRSPTAPRVPSAMAPAAPDGCRAEPRAHDGAARARGGAHDQAAGATLSVARSALSVAGADLAAGRPPRPTRRGRLVRRSRAPARRAVFPGGRGSAARAGRRAARDSRRHLRRRARRAHRHRRLHGRRPRGRPRRRAAARRDVRPAPRPVGARGARARGVQRRIFVVTVTSPRAADTHGV